MNIIRNADIISTTDRGVTTKTDKFNGDGINKAFTLTQSGIKNIRSVVVGAVTLVPLVDYTYTLMNTDSTNKVLNLKVAPELGVENVVISYDHSTAGDKIYDDYNMYTIKSEDKFPRIAFDIVSESINDKALQGAIYQSNLVLAFSVFGIGKNNTEDLLESLADFLLSQKLSMQRLNYLAIRGKSRIELWLDGGTFKIFKKTITLSAPYEFYV